MLAHLLARLLRFSFLLALVGASSYGYAANPCPADTPATCHHGKGLLWKIEHAGQAPSFLFGTIHLADPRVTSLPAPVMQRFDQADSFTMEVVVDESAMTQMKQTMFFQDERTLEGVLGAARYQKVKRALARHGTPLAHEPSKQKPWVVATTLAVPPQTNFLDLKLQARAIEQRKPLHALESMQEQLSIFDDLSLSDQIALVDDALAQHPQLAQRIEEMVRAYVARDLDEIRAIGDRDPLADADLQERVMHRLVVERNRRMLERMRPRLAEGNAFIAVGALHLPGENGLLQLLEQAGYNVHAVY